MSSRFSLFSVGSGFVRVLLIFLFKIIWLYSDVQPRQQDAKPSESCLILLSGGRNLNPMINNKLEDKLMAAEFVHCTGLEDSWTERECL